MLTFLDSYSTTLKRFWTLTAAYYMYMKSYYILYYR